ncbi:hypothetical protein D3C72_2384780 [compost metagenome]
MGEQQHVTQEIGGFVGKTEFHLLFASALAAPTPRQPVPGLRDLTNLLLKLQHIPVGIADDPIFLGVFL